MTTAEFQVKLDYFTNLLGIRQVKTEEGFKWGFATPEMSRLLSSRKAFIYLNTLSRYAPESSNSIDEQQSEFIFTQLEKLLP